MKMIINGNYVDASNKEVIEVRNPYNNELIDVVPFATDEDVDSAIEIAVEAQKKWNELSTYERGEIIIRFTEQIKQHVEELAVLLSKETGKIIKEARSEIKNTAFAFRSFVEKSRHIYDDTIPAGLEPNHEHNMIITTREPIGVVVGIIPFNSPGHIMAQKTAAALVAGNSVILKPAIENPLTILALGKMLNEAGVTPGAFQIVTGNGAKVGNRLCQSSKVNLISLTGSTKVGIKTFANASSNLTRISLELGGNDAFVVLEDADLDLAVKEAISGRLANTGQICAASKRIIISNKLKKQFEERLIEKIKKIKMGNPLDEETEIGVLIKESAAIEVERQVNKTIEQGGKLLIGGKRNGCAFEPTVISDIPCDADVMKDMEIFGPVISIIGFDSEEEALEIANASEYGLSGALFTSNMNKAFRFSKMMNTGEVVINGSSYFRSFEMAFGGLNKSGIGNEGVMTTYNEVTRIKSIVLKNIV